MSPSVSVRLLQTQSDARLVGFARAGHERAFEALVQRYRHPLLGYCRRLLLSEERAEDALQQALLQAWLALRAGTDVQNVKSWLYRIVHNAALNTLRGSGYDYFTLSESLTGADAPQEDLDRRIAVREALAGLAALPTMQREALLRTAVVGSTHRQAARDLGLSEPALRGLVYRARAALRAAAGAIMPPPLVSWALGSARGTAVGERLTEVGAGGGSAGVAGLLMKSGVAAVTAGVLASGVAVVHIHSRTPHRRLPARTVDHHTRPATAELSSATRTADTAPVADIHNASSNAIPRVTHRPSLQARPVRRRSHPAPMVIAPPPRLGSPDVGRSGDRHDRASGGGGEHDEPPAHGASGPGGGARAGGDGEARESSGTRDGSGDSSGNGTSGSDPTGHAGGTSNDGGRSESSTQTSRSAESQDGGDSSSATSSTNTSSSSNGEQGSSGKRGQ